MVLIVLFKLINKLMKSYMIYNSFYYAVKLIEKNYKKIIGYKK